MNLQKAQEILEGILNASSNTLIVIETRLQLEKCRELCLQLFQRIPPGAPFPFIDPDVAEARDCIDQALKKLDQGEVSAMLQHVREALAKISKFPK